MGGNIFKEHASPIVREHIRPTLKKYIEHLSLIFPDKTEVFQNFHPVGSVGKKEVSGDLDLAIDFKHLFKEEPYNPTELKQYKIIPPDWEILYKKIKSRARTSTDEMCKLKAFLRLLAESISFDSRMCVAKDKTTHGNLFTMFPQYDYYGQLDHCVQVDWMVGNLPWLKFAYHSGESGDLKGMHRTQLMVAMLSNKGHTFIHLKGIKEKESQKFVATTPEEAVDLFSSLYGNFTRDDFHNFITLHHFLKLYSSEQEYNKVIRSYLKILTISKVKIPNILQKLHNENT